MTNYVQLVEEVSKLNFHNTFNPYRDRCEVFDFFDSPIRRRSMLTSILNAACKVGVDSLWIGRDLGYRGGRRTGLAFTDQLNVDTHLKRWDISFGGKALVKGGAQAERTASVVWGMLEQIPAKIFLWNVFPLHPHEPDNSFSNRAHTARERSAGEEVLSNLIHILEPNRLVAIGQDAARSAEKCCGKREMVTVRHPSYGGLRDFQAGLRAAYKLPG